MPGPVSSWEDRGVERSGTLPNDWYTSRELFELEMKTLFREVWHLVGRVEQVAVTETFIDADIEDGRVRYKSAGANRTARGSRGGNPIPLLRRRLVHDRLHDHHRRRADSPHTTTLASQ